MRFWSREIAGWILLALGLGIFYLCLAFLTHRPAPQFLEAGPLLIMGIFVFRGGIHLLKVAVAARVCLQAREDVAQRDGALPRRSR